MLIFHPEALAEEYLVMGGEFDHNGNFFREKDVLANDFSNPILFGGEEYDVAEERWMPMQSGGEGAMLVVLSLDNGAILSLTPEQYHMSVY